jgi:hypothetical protein
LKISGGPEKGKKLGPKKKPFGFFFGVGASATTALRMAVY